MIQHEMDIEFIICHHIIGQLDSYYIIIPELLGGEFNGFESKVRFLRDER